jgi:putative 4-mercaptohistidine N1-methyltranferase
VEFFQADAVNLKPLYSNYDLIFPGNLIDRLYDPGRFLSGLHERLNLGGLLVVTSPYTWLEEFTSRDKWIGGFRKDGEPYNTLEGLRNLLREHFRLVAEPQDIEFVIRETRRKFQHTIAQLTVWERVS